MEAVLFIGVQGSGKTTFYLQRFAGTHVRLSLDMLRTRARERILVQACILARQPFVIDNTNVVAAHRAYYIEPARSAGFRVIGYYFRTPLKVAIARNAQRKGKSLIPVKGVVGTYKRLEIPKLEEGFDELITVDSRENFQFEVTPDVAS